MGTESEQPVTGAEGELVDRLISLIDRSTDLEPLWWHDYGMLVALQVNGLALRKPDESSRAAFVGDLRSQLIGIVDAGLSEDFLVRAIRRDLDDFARRRADTGASDREAESFRAHLRRVIDDPEARESWRARLSKQSERYLAMTDDEFVEEMRQALDRSPLATPVSADAAAHRWAASEAWLKAADTAVGDRVIERWHALNLQRALGR